MLDHEQNDLNFAAAVHRRLPPLLRMMTVVSDLDLPHFDYTEADLQGERFHERMRGLRGQSWIARTDLGFVVLDREAVNFFLKNRSAEFPGVRMFQLLGLDHGPLYDNLSKNIISLNGEQHRRLRALVRDEFTPKAADRYRPAMRSFLEQLFEPIASAGRCDFVTAFAKPYPALMIATVVGAPLDDAARLHQLSNLLQSQFDAIAVMTRREELERAAEEFEAYARELVERKRAQPGDDLVSRLIAVEQEGDRLSTEECVHLVQDVMNGGVDTTQSQLAHGSGCSPRIRTSGSCCAGTRRSFQRPPRRSCASSRSRRSPAGCSSSRSSFGESSFPPAR
jgi:cytochrome P450